MTRIQYGSKAFILSDEHKTTAFIALPMGGYTYHQFFSLDMAKEYVKVQLTSL